MQLFWGAAFFAIGAACASFAGVLAARLSTGQSFLSGRSRCDACNRPLPPRALVPIFSYAFFLGRAHCCGARLPLISPLSEFLLGALFVLSYAQLGFSLALPFLLAALVLTLTLVLYDLAHRILPLPLLAWLLVFSFAYAALAAPSFPAFGATLLGAGGVALFLALITLLSRGRAMGSADAPFAFALALLAGPLALSGFLYAFWIGAVIGIGILLARQGGPTMGVEVPFAPFLAAGFLLALFSGWNILTIIGL